MILISLDLTSFCCLVRRYSTQSIFWALNVHISLNYIDRLEEDKISLQKKLSRSRGMTTDQVMAAHSLETEKVIEEMKKRNAELEQQIQTIKYVQYEQAVRMFFQVFFN